MNGEVYQICKLTVGIKRALAGECEFIFEPGKYENRIEFHFIKKKTFFGVSDEIAYDPASWFEKCKKQGLIDVKMMMPTKVENRKVLGFANTHRSSILMFYKSGEVRYWIAQWEFDSKLKLWNIIYTENEWKDAPEGRPAFVNNTAEFITVLEKMEEFATLIEATYFAKVFRDAALILKGEKSERSESIIKDLPIPKYNECLLSAASKADVFGAMGSWNDEPPYMAHEKGMDEEYNTLSDELLTQIRLAILYAVNEW